MADTVTQLDRLEAVLSKLERIELELAQTKRIIKYFCSQEMGAGNRAVPKVQDKSGFLLGTSPTSVHRRPQDMGDSGDRKGLYPGQLDYQAIDKPSYLRKIQEEETEQQCLE